MVPYSASTQNIGFENWERVLMSERVKKIAIANPKIAPYGKAAEEALKLKGILDDVQPKIGYFPTSARSVYRSFKSLHIQHEQQYSGWYFNQRQDTTEPIPAWR